MLCAQTIKIAKSAESAFCAQGAESMKAAESTLSAECAHSAESAESMENADAAENAETTICAQRIQSRACPLKASCMQSTIMFLPMPRPHPLKALHPAGYLPQSARA